MTTEQPTQTAEPQPEPAQPTEQELMSQLDSAMKSGDFKAIAKVAREIDKIQRDKEQAELAEKKKALDAKTDKIKGIIAKALKPLVDSGELDQADGIWYSNDFGEKLVTCRLMKSAPRKSGGGGGTGKKFAVSTNDLLAKYGDKEWKDGINYQQAFESNTDGNFRYSIRQKLLKLDGQLS